MAGQQSDREDEARQIDEDVAVIDHLVHVFHSDHSVGTRVLRRDDRNSAPGEDTADAHTFGAPSGIHSQ